jgi:hypothetical protein
MRIAQRLLVEEPLRMWEEVLRTTTLAAILIAAIGFLARSLFAYWLDRDLERHKTKLEHQAQMEIAKTRNELRLVAFEYETRFSRLHEEIVRAILETYPPLRELYQAVGSYLSMFEWSGEPSKEEKLNQVSEKAKTFNQVYGRNRILFPKTLYKQLDEVCSALTRATNQFTSGLQREKKGVRIPDKYDHWLEAMNAMQDKIRPLFDAMHDEVQAILGFTAYGAKRSASETEKERADEN